MASARSGVALALGLLLLAAAGSARADVVQLRIVPEDSALTFKATSRLANADGRFHRFSGAVSLDPRDPTTARISMTVDAASIDTANTKRDNHLRSEDFFWVERFPSIFFESLAPCPTAGHRGGRSPHGARWHARDHGAGDGGGDARGLTARGQFDLKRSDYDINYQSFLNPVGDIVHVNFVFRGHEPGRELSITAAERVP